MADFATTVSNIAPGDVEAGQVIVDRENEYRAAQDPPETPLPYSTGAEQKASVEWVLNNKVLVNAWASWKREAAATKREEQNVRELWESATDAERAAAIAALGG